MKKILILSLISLFFMINNNVKCDITDIVSEDFTIDNTFPDQNIIGRT